MRTLSIETLDVAEGYTRYYLDIKADVTADLVQAVCDTYGYKAEIPDTSPEGRRERRMLPNPETPADFLRAHVVGHLSQILRDWKTQQALRQIQPPAMDEGAFQ